MTPEEILATIEATSDMADRLDSLKVNLEQRGWSPVSAEHASITMLNTSMQLATFGARR